MSKVTITVDASDRNEVNCQQESSISTTVVQPGGSATFDLANGGVSLSKGREVPSIPQPPLPTE
jgi:hypothetical protein